MNEELFQILAKISLPHLCEDARFKKLDRLDAYFSGSQYDHLQYDWDGRYNGYSDQADISPGWFVPLKRRKPSLNIQLAKLVVSRFSSMLLGEDRFPAINVEGDQDAEDFVRSLVEVSQFATKLGEARDKGGTCGTAVMSFAFVEGKPQIAVHRAKHMRVLQWHDRYEFRPAIVLKCYLYKKSELVDGKPKENSYYYARVWTQDSETVWEPIPAEAARSDKWIESVPSYTVQHAYGECPVYWAQNLPDSDNEDGISDFDGLCDDFDEINRLVSSTSKGTIANVDPTLVIKMDPSMNSGAIRKGSENAIFSPNGADYLELSGSSIQTAMALSKDLVKYAMDVSGVVLSDPEKISGAAQSAAALRIIFQPMINQCDKLRSQYGDRLAAPLLLGMLRAARKVQGAGGEIFTTADGRRVQNLPTVVLPPKVTVETDDDGNQKVSTTERKPGTAEILTLQWPQYFKPTQADIGAGVKSAVEARGTLISDKTATRYVAQSFGVTDIDAEILQIKQEVEERAAMMPGPEMPPNGGMDDTEEPSSTDNKKPDPEDDSED